MDGDWPLAFLRFHIVRVALFFLIGAVPQISRADIRQRIDAGLPVFDQVTVFVFRPGNDGDAVQMFVIDRHAPGNLGRTGFLFGFRSLFVNLGIKARLGSTTSA